MKKKIAKLLLLFLLFSGSLSISTHSTSAVDLSGGQLVKTTGSDTIWVVTSDKTYILPSALETQEEILYRQAIMASYGWTMDQVVYILQSQLESKVLGGNATIKSGTQYLIRTAGNSQLYRISSDNYITPVNKSDYSSYAEVVVPDAYWANYNKAVTTNTLIITTASLPGGTVGVAYRVVLLASGGSESYTWSFTGLPAGLFGGGGACTANTVPCFAPGEIYGTPAAASIPEIQAGAGTYTVTVTITSGTQSASKKFNLVIVAAVAPSITVLSPNGGEKWEIGKTYQVTWKASGFSPNDYVKVVVRKGDWDSGSAVNYGDTPANTESYRNIAILNPAGNDTSFYEPGKNYFIDISLVTSNGTPLSNDFSNAPFSIVAASTSFITVTSPNGGETIEALRLTKMEHYLDWVSTGGGAMLSFLGGERMPGLKGIVK